MRNRLFRLALEESPADDAVATQEKTVVMKGPLSQVYADALNLAYAKEPPADDSADATAATPDTPAEAAAEPAQAPVENEAPAEEAAIEPPAAEAGSEVNELQSAAPAADEAPASEAPAEAPAEEPAKVEGEEVAQESQANDMIMMKRLAESVAAPEAQPESFLTVYGVSEADLNDETVVDVTKDLAASDNPEDFVLILDATQPGPNGEVGGMDERVEQLGTALECLVESFGGKVFHSLREFAAYRAGK